ncbi:hypothetical protein CAEBREN_07603 [Caenorhabditis brenneri]|uniref:Receptor L-domain domain-containing protein n=1 Tax=Caenorhabditis brenneri TaxID=135651 RepID=G0MUG0_CAEBE|nr:hypothetical protein CAEBREN_07603 [Caenorhabditis brenneri]
MIRFILICPVLLGLGIFLVNADDKFFKMKNCDQNCTFKEVLTSQNIGSFPNCSRVCTYLLINQYTNVSQTKLASVFKNMKVLVGSLTIVNTNYTSAKFLAPLEQIECDTNTSITFNSNEEMVDTGMINLKSIDCPNFILFGGKKMTKLNFPSLKNFTYNTSIEISVSFIAPLSSFCITTEEAKAFFSIRIPSSIALVTRYCEPVINDKMCLTPATGCVEIFGNVEIGQDFQMDSMKSVEVIYGYLVVNGTELTNFDSFQSLKYISTLDYGVSALQVVDNPILTNATFPSLKRIYSNSIDEVVFKDNAEELLLDPWLCFGLRYLLSMDTDDAPNFDGESCEQVEKNLPGRNRAMATAADFFKDIKNTRMCLLYEYLRGMSPAQTQTEMFKACRYEIKEDVIQKWFARFAAKIFSVDITNETEDINEDEPEKEIPEDKEEDYKTSIAKIKKDNPSPFKLDEDSKELLNFFTDLAKLKTEEGFKVTELEISVKNDAQPKYVLITIQYDTKAKTKEFLSAEIYHCSNGIVLRRGKQTKLIEGAQHYKYYKIARAACIKLLDTLKNDDKKEEMVRVDALKLSIDTNDNKPTKMTEHQENHVDFFKILMNELGINELSDPLSDKDLIKFHSKVKVSKELNITYGKCEIKAEKDSTDEQILQPIMEWITAFRETFETDSKAKCVIQRTVQNVERMQSLVKYSMEIKYWKLKVAVEKDKIIISRNRSSISSSASPSKKSSPKTDAPSTSQQSSSSAAPELMDQQETAEHAP